MAPLVDVAWQGGVFNFGTVLAPPVDVAWRGGSVFNFGAPLTPTQETDSASLSFARVGILRRANTMQMEFVYRWMLVIWL